ncbi:MAG: EAL domain-containing protein [Candidatus Manganitrophus sp. SA1]|nr:EAL domain-containing protein [Candidatus Manganitrophus morganii]
MTPPRQISALIVEDSEEDTELLLRELKKGNYNPVHERVDTWETMKAALKNQNWDIVFSDYTMPQFKGTDALALLRETESDIPFFFVSGTIDEDMAVTAMKAGANDYIIKGNLKRLVPAVDRELREAEVRRERNKAEATIHHMAYYDPLTDLPNRTLLRDRLQQAILATPQGGKAAGLLLIDLDRFREINDTLGHQRGDLLLKQIGPRLREVLQETHLVARLGGDEFAVLLPHIDTKDASFVASKIIKIMERPFLIEGMPIVIEPSVGIALSPDHGENPDSLIQRADIAMYVAKENKKGYAFYSAEIDRHSPRRLALLGELRNAIESNQLFLHYQPKIHLKTGRITGVEALVRWQHPEYGIVPPDQFISIAEHSGLIKPLTLWVIKTALYQSKAWHQEGRLFNMAVNLSARNLEDAYLPGQIAELLKTSGVTASSLELEITESALMVNPFHALEILTRLNKIGVQLSIDDFGTGYSSLGYLKRLPVNQIKIDKSFVKDMATDEDDAIIVRSTIELSHNLGLKVIAEGVESQPILDKLAALGCDSVQGYFISRPIPAHELIGWFKDTAPLKGWSL